MFLSKLPATMITLGLLNCAAFAATETPCEQIDKACSKAGFIKSSPNTNDGKDLEKSCVDPILKGQTVPGVTLDPELGKKCLESIPKTPTKKVRR